MCSGSFSSDTEEVELSSIAPMEMKEQESLYFAIQGLVGKWWNGSDLYPDPCGWTPIQVHIYTYTHIYYPIYIYIGSFV